jgi:hypothetical protein
MKALIQSTIDYVLAEDSPSELRKVGIKMMTALDAQIEKLPLG